MTTLNEGEDIHVPLFRMNSYLSLLERNCIEAMEVEEVIWKWRSVRSKKPAVKNFSKINKPEMLTVAQNDCEHFHAAVQSQRTDAWQKRQLVDRET